MPIKVVCTNPECARSTTVKDALAGKRVKCPHPGCGRTLAIPGPEASSDATRNQPSAALRSAKPIPAPSDRGDDESSGYSSHEDDDLDEQSTSPTLWRNPEKLAAVLFLTSGFCFLLFVLVLIAARSRETSTTGPMILSMLLFVVSLASGVLAIRLLTIKQRAIAEHGKPVSLLFGLIQLVAWEQNEGIIFLKDKRIREVVYGPKHGGGFRLVYPILGEEFRAKIPLTLQLTWFHDERVLTRESIQMAVKIAFWWRVSHLETFFFRINQDAHALQDGDDPSRGISVASQANPKGRLASAEMWLRTDVEASLRRLISETSTFLIVSKRAASHLHTGADDQTNPADLHPATPDVLASYLKDDLNKKVHDYGLYLERVEVQEVQLPAAIQQAVDDVWIASTQPTKSRHESEALRQHLEVLCNALGKDAVGLSEIVSKLPPGRYTGNPLGMVADLMGRMAKTTPAPKLPPAPPGAGGAKGG